MMNELSKAAERRWTIITAIIVFVIAISLRLPSCYESFWIDELHSAWVVWNDFTDVGPRSTMGHQSPFYFWGLWLWKQVVGESEVALRLSSVLAVAVACIVLLVGVSKWSKSLVAGAAAGLVLAIESNSLFFGTELRPYAFVILFSSLAVAGFLRLIDTRSRHDDRLAWTIFLMAILLATLCHPTAIGTLAILPVALICLWFRRDRQQLFRVSLLDSVLGMSGTGIGLLLWRMTLADSWQQRDNWSSFASAKGTQQLWQAWEWSYLVLIPLATCLFFTKLRSSASKQSVRVSILLAAIAVIATGLFWVVSRLNVAPIWHHRFYIAVLPILACVVGCCIGTVHQTIRSYRSHHLIAATITLIVVGLLAIQQRHLSQLKMHPVALVTRGEDWRGAMAWIQANAEPDANLYLDAGLIESQYRNESGTGQSFPVPMIVSMSSPGTETPPTELTRYISFPLQGPYRLTSSDFDSQVALMPADWSIANQTRGGYLIARRSARSMNFPQTPGVRVMLFGGVSVIAWPNRSH
jgi:mannosyltransferase